MEEDVERPLKPFPETLPSLCCLAWHLRGYRRYQCPESGHVADVLWYLRSEIHHRLVVGTNLAISFTVDNADQTCPLYPAAPPFARCTAAVHDAAILTRFAALHQARLQMLHLHSLKATTVLHRPYSCRAELCGASRWRCIREADDKLPSCRPCGQPTNKDQPHRRSAHIPRLSEPPRGFPHLSVFAILRQDPSTSPSLSLHLSTLGTTTPLQEAIFCAFPNVIES